MATGYDPGEWAPGPQKAPSGRRTSGLAIASQVLGVLSIFACLSFLAGVPAVILGIVGLAGIRKSQGRLAGAGLAVGGIVSGAIGIVLLPVLIALLLLPAVQSAREAARRTQCTNNLRQIGLALHNYQSVNGCFPPAYTTDDAGRPRHSWRVMILPYLESTVVYNAYNFHEAWDHPANTTVATMRMSVYQCPSDPSGTPGVPSLASNYSMVTGPGTFFDPARKAVTSLADIADGTADTLAVVETRQTVPWAAPDHVVVDPARLAGSSFGADSFHPGGFNALVADGSVRFLKKSTTPAVVRALLTIAGGEVVSADSY